MKRRSARASVLLLMPAALVIVLLLGAISVDAAILHLRQREAANVAFDAANDAAGAALDLDRLRADGDRVLDPATAKAVAADTIAAARVTDLRLVDVAVVGDEVVVRVAVEARRLFGPGFGATRVVELSATRRATAVDRGPDTATP